MPTQLRRLFAGAKVVLAEWKAPIVLKDLAIRPTDSLKGAPENPLNVKVRVVEPTETQIQTGLSMLSECLPIWSVTPALLVIDPGLPVIVSFRAVTHTRFGFQLVLDVEEPLAILETLKDKRSLAVFYAWNQLYGSFSRDGINAPYSFYLFFGQQGIARAKQLWAAVPSGMKAKPWLLRGMFRQCFNIGMTEEDFRRLLRAHAA